MQMMQEVIQVTGLSKSYGSLKAVDNVNLTVPRGTVFGLLGANWAGKARRLSVFSERKGRIRERYRFLEGIP